MTRILYSDLVSSTALTTYAVIVSREIFGRAEQTRHMRQPSSTHINSSKYKLGQIVCIQTFIPQSAQGTLLISDYQIKFN